MAITRREAQTEILEDLAGALDQLELAVTRLGEAYELLATGAADRMEEGLFMPLQRAFGRGKRTHAQFAASAAERPRELAEPLPGRRSDGARGMIEQASLAVAEADQRLAALQDSELPIEFGDPELRTGLAETRAALGPVPDAARQFLRTLGR